MPKRRDLTKEQILAAINKTKSNRAAARYLNVSYHHYRKWAKFYKDSDTGETLFKKHLNPSGKGIPKFLNNGKKDPALIDIIEGRVNAASFSPDKMKYRLITEGFLEEKCNNCGFCERRVSDYKIPLILNFKDKNKQNYRKENIEMLCYNCYYLFIGDIFTQKQIKGLEDHVPVNQSQTDWELDDYQTQRLKELGLNNFDLGANDIEDYDLISRI
jgi:hypothetical protein